jgi:aminoglycoside phosphotransferase (APT) family kinase protein
VQALADRFAAYVSHRWPDAREVRVEGLTRIHGGASRETYRLRLRLRRDGGGEEERRLILRRDPAGSLIETERAVEYRAYAAFHGSAVPVPAALWLEEDPSWLERPFFVMEEVTGGEASPQALLAPPYAEHLERIGERKWTILGEIHRADPEALGLTDVMEPVPLDRCFERELAHWERVIDEDELAPQPIARAGIRWLRRNPPRPAQKLAVVHADFRTGNLLVSPAGEILAVLDWEMAHLGDPLEDLAWSINRTWCWARDGRAGGLLPRERAIAIWEKASGLVADPDDLRWWEVFSSVKGLGIWISSAKEYSTGRNADPVLGFTGWWLTNAQDRALLESLGRLG